MIILFVLSHLIQEPKPITVNLQRDPVGLRFENNVRHGASYSPTSMQLSAERGSGIRKEPNYEGTPLYGTVKVGNGPDSSFSIVLAHRDQTSTLYVDINRNGDLTDDPVADWKQGEPLPGKPLSYRGTVVFPASYQSGSKKWTAPFGLNFLWTPGSTQLNYFRAGWSTGTATIGGERVEIKLVEEANDGIFGRRFDTVADLATMRMSWIYLNELPRDARGTFAWNGINYLATIAPDGSKVTLTPTVRVVAPPPRVLPPERRRLAPGTPAPDFTVESYRTGGPVRLSDYKGKIVVLKFWATWCGPCIASMPHFEKVYKAVKTQGVEILAVCVGDEKSAYTAWAKKNAANYSYPFFYDPAGRTPGQSISIRLYRAMGIPTVFVIDKEGKIAATIVGYDEGDKRVDEALEKLGVKVSS